MEIATGYFAKARTYADMGYALVSISRVAPWFIAKALRVYPLECLAPTDEILALKDRPLEYEKRYREEVLRKVKAIDVYRNIDLIAHQENTDKVVLLCYESPEKFCHRHIVASWLLKEMNLKVDEVDFKDFEIQQRDLFESD